ncbi:hypothetical protein CALCODRAFT_157478 [Calocera cornea HHB12733]|uniref:Uncharacterized protein n=1 Tax=Calocera cornea HHB12733 TaxID=1353952 RepID=A0A165I0A7_9BASI|nr:hypothetical protein CALCODRAFT_157478 [Calocera cornea HHB12733]
MRGPICASVPRSSDFSHPALFPSGHCVPHPGLQFIPPSSPPAHLIAHPCARPSGTLISAPSCLFACTHTPRMSLPPSTSLWRAGQISLMRPLSGPSVKAARLIVSCREVRRASRFHAPQSLAFFASSSPGWWDGKALQRAGSELRLLARVSRTEQAWAGMSPLLRSSSAPGALASVFSASPSAIASQSA